MVSEQKMFFHWVPVPYLTMAINPKKNSTFPHRTLQGVKFFFYNICVALSQGLTTKLTSEKLKILHYILITLSLP
jgi:hypothetical protein